MIAKKKNVKILKIIEIYEKLTEAIKACDGGMFERLSDKTGNEFRKKSEEKMEN